MAPRPPFTKTRLVVIPWKTLVVKADPDYERQKLDEVEYVFSGNRVFTSRNSNKRGVYANPPVARVWILEEGRWDDAGGWRDEKHWND